MIKVYFKNGDFREFAISQYKFERQKKSVSGFQFFKESKARQIFDYELLLNFEEISAITGEDVQSHLHLHSYRIYLKKHEAISIKAHSFETADGEICFYFHTNGNIETSAENKQKLNNVYCCASEVLAVELDES